MYRVTLNEPAAYKTARGSTDIKTIFDFPYLNINAHETCMCFYSDDCSVIPCAVIPITNIRGIIYVNDPNNKASES